MELEQLLQLADSAFREGREQEGVAYLKKAGESGNISAALDYAYFSASVQPESVLDYLSNHPQSASPVIQYHRALIDRFNFSRAWTKDIIHTLVSLAQRGHTESLLVLKSWCVDDASVTMSLNGCLRKTAPNLYSQLCSGKGQARESADKLDVAMVGDVIKQRVEKLDSLNSEILNEEIKLTLTEQALSGFECIYIQKRFAALLGPSLVVNPQTGEPMKDSIRTSEVATLSGELADWIVRDIDLRLAKISGTVATKGEPLNLLSYSDGQQYKNHYDAFSQQELKALPTQRAGGQRAVTAIAYLSSVKSGGETMFPYLNQAVKPVQGSVVSFNNIDRAGKILKNSYHAGAPVYGATKWTLTKWSRVNTTSYGNFAHGTFIKEKENV